MFRTSRSETRTFIDTRRKTRREQQSLDAGVRRGEEKPRTLWINTAAICSAFTQPQPSDVNWIPSYLSTPVPPTPPRSAVCDDDDDGPAILRGNCSVSLAARRYGRPVSDCRAVTNTVVYTRESRSRRLGIRVTPRTHVGRTAPWTARPPLARRRI